MKKRNRAAGFTLIELLVVVAIIALLISILLPSLQKAREQGKLAKCLANMRGIGQASLSYASEDSREHIVPIHQSMTENFTIVRQNFPGIWWWRTALPFVYGGRTAVVPFPVRPNTNTNVMMDDYGFWGARTRPLNKYTFANTLGPGNYKDLPWFHCPSDTGYPDSPWVQDAPRWSHGIPCYDMLGNSYRINVAGLIWRGAGQFSVGALGHRASSLLDMSRLAMYSEPMFYNFSRQDGTVNPDLLPIRGWHRKVMTDNVTYADGSARSTTVNELSSFDRNRAPGLLEKMGYTPDFGWRWFLRRGTTWRTDCYPTGGAYIPRFLPEARGGQRVVRTPLGNYTGWPWSNYQDNFGLTRWD